MKDSQAIKEVFVNKALKMVSNFIGQHEEKKQIGDTMIPSNQTS